MKKKGCRCKKILVDQGSLSLSAANLLFPAAVLILLHTLRILLRNGLFSSEHSEKMYDRVESLK
jgi:uncharacterized protein YhhL (DUF1145 family)